MTSSQPHAPPAEPPQLRVLIANQRSQRLVELAHHVERLGHEVVARELEVRNVAATTTRTSPDIALVALGSSHDHALELIGEIVREASCPVIALLAVDDPAYIREAAGRGVFASIVDTSDEELRGAIDVTLQRFHEYQSLKGAFGRRATIEQAKGILMGRDGLTEDDAFARLREHSQARGRKLAEVAEALIRSHVQLAHAKLGTEAVGPGPAPLG